MTKPVVTYAGKAGPGTQAPFLRGVLIRSLQDAGLSLEQAQWLAGAVREELEDTPAIASRALEARVVAHLERDYGPAAVQRYLNPSPLRASVMVCDARGRSRPFSRGRHRHYLESCGLSLEEAVRITARIYDHLIHKGLARIDSSRLARLTYRCLRRELGAEVARRYAVWVDFMRSDRPMLLFIGGVPGSGKTTIAAEAAHRLEIVRMQSTDMLREVMRVMIPQQLIPALHTSSFKAWEVQSSRQTAGSEDAIARGYLAQAQVLAVACEAVISRALRERVSIILEGVHLHPSLQERVPRDSDAIVLFVMLAVLKPDTLRERFQTRGREAPDRRAERYLSHFDAIWQLQSFMLAEAERCKVPIVPNDETEASVQRIMRIMIDALARNHFPEPGASFLRPNVHGQSAGRLYNP